MFDTQKTWDDIPSMAGLEMEWDYKFESPLGKRKHERMTSQDVASLLGVRKIRAKVATGKKTVNGLLSDICAGGMALILSKDLFVNQDVKIGFFLGTQKIVSRAVVRQSVPVKKDYKVGFQFQDINQEDSNYINGLYASRRLNRL
jgi:hypothetical protein